MEDRFAAIRREYNRVRDAVASHSLSGRVSARGSVLVHSHVSMLAPSPGRLHVKPMNPGTSAGVSKVVVMRLRRTSEPTKGEHHNSSASEVQTPPPHVRRRLKALHVLVAPVALAAHDVERRHRLPLSGVTGSPERRVQSRLRGWPWSNSSNTSSSSS